MAEVLERRTFVGRALELERLSALFVAARSGSGRVAVVAGEAGIGKTRLVERFTVDARSAGAMVLEGACLPTGEATVAYAPFVEILRRVVREAPPGALPALLGPARAELTRILPELAGRAVDLPTASDDRTAQARLFELVVGVVSRLARSAPVVVVIEDLQWADRATLDLLTYIVRAIVDQPVLMVLTLRGESMAGEIDVLEAVSEIERAEHVERIDVPPLRRDDVALLLTALLERAAPAAFVDRVADRTDGNPFFVEELVLAAPSDPEPPLPPVIRDVLAAHVGRLSREAREALLAAAVAGRRIDDDLLARSLGLTPRQLGGRLREAGDAGILVRSRSADETVWSFRHELLREAIEDEALPIERKGLHLAFAEALEERASGGAGVNPSDLARHWLRAGRPDRALDPTIQAARDAELAFAFGDALGTWTQAAALLDANPALAGSASAGASGCDRSEILERAADCAVLAGEYRRAVDLGRQALGSVDPAADPGRAGHLLERLRWYLWEAGDRAAAAQAVEAALRLLPRDPPSRALARALGQQAGIALMARDYAFAIVQSRAAIAAAEAVASPLEAALPTAVLGWSEAVLGDVDAGVGRLREAIALAERLGSTEGVALGITSLASLLDRVGRHDEARAAALDGYSLAERLGVARTYGGLLLGYAARAQIALGLLDEADDATARGLALHPSGRTELWLLVNRGRLLACRGRFGEASALLRRATEIELELGQTEYRLPLLAARVELAAWSERPADALDVIAEALALEPDPGPPDPAMAWLAALGLRIVADLAEAARRGRDELRRADIAAIGDRIVEAVQTARADQARQTAVADLGFGRADAIEAQIEAEGRRVRELDTAADWSVIARGWEAIGRPLPAGYARYRQAAAGLRDREPRDAAASALRAADEVAVRLGALPLRTMAERLAAQARIELAPAPAESEDAGGPAEGLTDREIEVLRLVAGGWTNQQIADELFITRKTASVHVSNIMAKLGVRSRGEAAALAHRVGLATDAPPPPGSS